MFEVWELMPLVMMMVCRTSRNIAILLLLCAIMASFPHMFSNDENSHKKYTQKCNIGDFCWNVDELITKGQSFPGGFSIIWMSDLIRPPQVLTSLINSCLGYRRFVLWFQPTENHQIMKVSQALVPLDFVLHCSNRLRPHRWSCLSFKHIETLTLFRSPQIFAAVSPLTMTSFVPGGQNWDPFEADWMHWVPNKSKSDRSG